MSRSDFYASPFGTAYSASYWGLHCCDKPVAALAEASRILKPDARLVGSTFVAGSESLRQRLLVRPGAGDFGQVGSAEDVVDWLRQAGFAAPAIRRSGPMMFFEAQRSSTVTR